MTLPIILQSDNNILCIPNYILDSQEMIPLKEHIKDKSYLWCNFIIPSTTSDDNSYLVLYIENLSSFLPNNDFRPLYNNETLQYIIQNISSFMTAVVFNYPYIEIYTVCTNPDHRSKSYAKKLIFFLQIYFNPQRIWLGIDPFSFYFVAALKTYAAVDFEYPYLSNQSPIGRKFGDLYVVGLNWYRHRNTIYGTYEEKVVADQQEQNILKYKETVRLAKSERIKYLSSIGYCSMVLYLSDSCQETIKPLIKEEAEYSGKLKIRCTSRTDKCLLIIDEPPLEGNQADAPFLAGNITYHTHPLSCYVNEQCKYGWPSDQDNINVLDGLDNAGTRLHFVFTVEGIYTISIIPQFENLWNLLNKNCKSLIKSALKKYITPSHGERHYSKEDLGPVLLNKRRSIKLLAREQANTEKSNWYIRKINSIDLDTLLTYPEGNLEEKNQINTWCNLSRKVGSTKIKIFNTSFLPYNYITESTPINIIYRIAQDATCLLQHEMEDEEMEYEEDEEDEMKY